MNLLILAIAAVVVALVEAGLIVALSRLQSQHLFVAHSVRDLAATIAKMQADRQAPRPANAPPVGSFSFKGAAK